MARAAIPPQTPKAARARVAACDPYFMKIAKRYGPITALVLMAASCGPPRRAATVVGSKNFTDRDMRRMNYEVDGLPRGASDVARQFLLARHLIP